MSSKNASGPYRGSPRCRPRISLALLESMTQLESGSWASIVAPTLPTSGPLVRPAPRTSGLFEAKIAAVDPVDSAPTITMSTSAALSLASMWSFSQPSSEFNVSENDDRPRSPSSHLSQDLFRVEYARRVEDPLYFSHRPQIFLRILEGHELAQPA